MHSLGTGLCDPCWELKVRMSAQPERAEMVRKYLAQPQMRTIKYRLFRRLDNGKVQCATSDWRTWEHLPGDHSEWVSEEMTAEVPA